VNISFPLFCILVLVYAFFSTPFPVSVSFVEVLIGVISILFCLLSLPRLRHASSKITFVVLNVFSYILFLSVIGIYVFISQSLSISDFIRDTSSMLFVLLVVPLTLLFYSAFHANSAAISERKLRIISECLSLAGLALAFRALFSEQEYGNSIINIGKEFFLGDLTYKQYDPLVSFSAIFSIQVLFLELSKPRSTNSIRSIVVEFASVAYRLVSIALIALSYFAIVQRFPLALMVLCFFLMIIKYLSSRSPRFRVSFILCLVGLTLGALYAFDVVYPNIASYYVSFNELLYAKSDTQGGLSLAYKLTEAYPVFQKFSVHDMLFGLGLGSSYHNTEIGADVRFTHSLITYIPLKFGMLGVFGSSMLVFSLRYHISRSIALLRNSLFSKELPSCVHLLVSSSFAPLVLSFLQPTYKVFSYPIFLAVILAF